MSESRDGRCEAAPGATPATIVARAKAILPPERLMAKKNDCDS